jgi:hypothetical protein
MLLVYGCTNRALNNNIGSLNELRAETDNTHTFHIMETMRTFDLKRLAKVIVIPRDFIKAKGITAAVSNSLFQSFPGENCIIPRQLIYIMRKQ